MMKRYTLDFNTALQYFQDNLNGTNTLSTMLAQLVTFSSGNFFTFLPELINSERINLFNYGGISKKSVKNEIKYFIQDKLKSNTELSAIFDDTTSTYELGDQDPLFCQCGYIIDREIYYSIHHTNSSLELIEQCLYASTAVWHSLCVITEHDLQKNKRQLCKEDLEKICFSAKIIILSAYDDEGHIIWEQS